MSTVAIVLVVALVSAVGVAIYLKTQLEGQRTIGRARAASMNDLTVRYDKSLIHTKEKEGQLAFVRKERDQQLRENKTLREFRSDQNTRINELLIKNRNSHQRVGKKMLPLGVNEDGSKV